MKLFKKRTVKEVQKNFKRKSIKSKIKVLGKLHKQPGVDMKPSIRSLARLFAFRKGVVPNRNPKDKRKKR